MKPENVLSKVETIKRVQEAMGMICRWELGLPPINDLYIKMFYVLMLEKILKMPSVGFSGRWSCIKLELNSLSLEIRCAKEERKRQRENVKTLTWLQF